MDQLPGEEEPNPGFDWAVSEKNCFSKKESQL